MNYNNVKGFGWARGEVGEKKRTEEVVVKTNENKTNARPQYLKLHLLFVLFFVLYNMCYFILCFFLSWAAFFFINFGPVSIL